MNKLDKLLYGGFAVVLIGGITALLVSVFFPQRPIVEDIAEQPAMETDSPPAEEPTQPENGYVAYYLDDEGNKVFLTAEDIAESEAYDEEFKREEAERIAKEKAEKEWWESRQDWIDRFPFQPTYHPEIAYDPSVYDPSNLPPREERDEAYEQHRDLVRNHSFLRKFYESRLPYTEEFEQMHDIIAEEVGEFDNIFDIGRTFNSLKYYHQARAKDPDAIYRKNAQVYQPQPPPQPPPSILDGLTPQQLAAYKALPGRERRSMTAELRKERAEEMRKRIEAFHASQRYQTVDITWGEQAGREKDSIIGALMIDDDEDQPRMSKEQATRIQERLLNEIPAEGFLEMGNEVFGYSQTYQRELKAGDPLLIK